VQGAGFLEGQATVLAFKAEYNRYDGHAKMDTCTFDSSMFIEYIFNLVHQQIRRAGRFILATG
jgi:hypothetical protein